MNKADKKKVIIENVLFVSGSAGFYFDDQMAIRNGAERDGFIYCGTPETKTFTNIRLPSECVSVMLILSNGQIACGDCCSVQYSGACGRDPLFVAGKYIPWMDSNIKPLLIGIEINSFRKQAELIDTLFLEGAPVHTAIRYGITQALLDAVSKVRNCTITEVVAEEYNSFIADKPVRIFAQSGEERRTNVDKMIIKQLDVMPHGLFNSPAKFGRNGELLKEFVEWMKNRVLQLRTNDEYCPEFHIDSYAMPGLAFDNNFDKIVDYLHELQLAASPFDIRIEAPMDMGNRTAQIEAFKKLRELLERKGLTIGIVADEWCNTLEDIELFAKEKAGHMLQIKTPDLGGINNSIEAVLTCQKYGIEAYLGGSCTETDVSARICAQIALAVQPYQLLAKPGMGVDEGFMIIKNEMRRTLNILANKKII